MSVSFTNLSAASAAATYAWDFGNGNSSTLKNPSAIYLDEKTYTVTLTVTDGAQTSTKTRTLTVYKKPTVDFTTPKPKVCLPDGVQFTSTATPGDGTITNYQWDFGDGSTGSGFGSGILHYYPFELTPAVSVTVTNSYGCISSLTKTNLVEVLPKIEPLFIVNKTLLCTLDSSIQLTNNSNGPGVLSYLWDFGDGTTSTVKNPVHQFTRKGVFGVKLTVTNNVGCSVAGSPVSVNAAFFQTAFTSQLLCRQANFTGSAYLFPTASQWVFGDGGTSGTYSNTSHVYAAAAAYTVSLINTYNNTCKDTATKTINVQDLVNFNSAITGPSTLCKNNTVTFTSTSSTAPSNLRWDYGDGTAIFNTTGTSISHTYAQPGTYTLTLVNTFGTCSETVTKTVTVNDLPSTTGFVTDFGGVCGAPVTVIFRDTTPGAVAWQWQMDGTWNTVFATAQNAPRLFTSDGNYLIYLTATNAAGCTRTVSKYISIARPSASIFISQSSSPRNYYDCDSLTIKMGVTANQTISSYSWNLGNGTTSTLAAPQVHYSNVGVYNITLNYTTESGCMGTAGYAARVYDKPAANFSYSIPCGNSLGLNFTDTSPFSDQWDWQFGDGGVAYWVNPQHFYRDTGRYTVRFINAIGHCKDTIVKQVYANVLPSSLNITKAQNTCDGNRGTVSFDQRSVRASGGTWNFGDGTVIPYDSSNHNVMHTYTATGTYTVTLTGSYGNCNYTDSRTVYVLLKQSPVLTASQTQICASNSLNVQIGGLVTNPFAPYTNYYQYTLTGFQYNNGTMFTGSAFSSNGFNPLVYNGTLSNFAAGTTSLRAIITESGSGCQDTTNFIALQVNGPIAGFKIINNNGCYKTPFIFTDTSRSATNVALTRWQWDFGDGTVADNTTNADVPHRYLTPGNYFVRLTVTDATGCTKTVNATANARGPKAAFTTSGLFVPNVPLNTTINFFNNTYASNSAPVYKWDYGDGANSNTYSGNHTYAVAGTYTVMLVANDASISCADTARQVINVKDFNTAFTFTKSYLGESSCPPMLVRINNLSVGYTRLLWDFGDGATSTQSYPSHTYTQPGLYRITLTTYGYNGLSGTYIDSVQVSKPSVSFAADVLKGCLSQPVTFTMNSQNAVNHLWDFGDGAAGTSAASQTHVYLSPGIYNPRLIVKDTLGCQASKQLADTVVIDSLSIAIKGIPALICDSALIQFTPDVQSFAATKLGTLLQYKWNFGTSNPADTSNVKNAAFRYTQPGSYTVTFTVTSPYGCSKQTTATFTVQQKAHGAIMALVESCEQATVSFTGTATPQTGVQWAWDFANGNTAASSLPPAQLYSTPGTYNVTLILIKNGCMDTAKHRLTVYAKPVVNAQPQQKILCLGDSVLLSASGGGTYAWTPSAGLNNAAIATPMASPKTSSFYRVQVTSAKGCVNSDSLRITVAQPVAVNVAGTTSLCKGEKVQFTASGATSYQWINNTAGLSSTSIAAPFASPSATTTYTVVGKDAYNCFNDTADITVAVHDLPTVNAGPDIEIVVGTPYTLKAVGSADVTGWLWSPGADLSCTTCASPIATPKMETAYSVKVNNAWGCTASDIVVLKLQCAVDKVFIPDAFTPNRDGKNDVFYITGSGVKIVRYLRIYDRWGGLMFQKTMFGIGDVSSGWDGRVNGQPVASGSYVYLAELECSSGERFVRKGTVTVIQ